jgi:hypothetical protein
MLSQWITPKVLEIKWKHEASQLLKGRKKHAILTPSHLQKEGKVISTLPSYLLPWWLDFASFLSFWTIKQLGKLLMKESILECFFFNKIK